MPVDPQARTARAGTPDGPLRAMTARLGAMLADLEELVTCESFSADHQAVAGAARVVAEQGTRLLAAAPETVVIDGVTHLRWTFGAPRVLLLGHHDTVWPIGTLRRLPWSLRDGVATGPGVFDMKAGLVQMFHALATLPSLDGVCVLVTGDEEVGSTTSRTLIEETARGCAAAFVLEASADGGALKTARKGVSRYEVVVHGRAAHAGLEPAKGVNAAIEVAHQILALESVVEQVTRYGGPGTTITPTLLAAGTAANTVPARAALSVDVRATTLAAQRRVHELLQEMRPKVPGARLEIQGVPNRPPLEPGSSAGLFDLATRLADRRGIGPLRGVAVGGASDGNFSAGVGCPTLDGLGAVGGGAHADDEHVLVSEMPARALLLADLIEATR